MELHFSSIFSKEIDLHEDVRISSVSVNGLFSLYDHHIELRNEERVTVIHGPNGVGKTVVLRCLNAILSGRMHYFLTIPFDDFTVKCTDGTTFSIRKSLKADDGAQGLILTIGGDGRKARSTEIAPADPIKLARMIERQTPWLFPLSEGRYRDERTKRVLTSEEVVARHGKGKHLPAAIVSLAKMEDPEQLKRLRDRVKVKFIETNRLYHMAEIDGPFDVEKTLVSTVTRYAKELFSSIESTLAQYARVSQQLDQSFPHRLIHEEVIPPGIDELSARLNELERKQAKLRSMGLLEPAKNPIAPSNLHEAPDYKRVPLTLFIQDNEKKIATLEALAERVSVLLDGINRKFNNKFLKISREHGLVAESVNGEPLELESLSSGEQHEIVLLYELLFNTSPNTLVLIDEPELSLHVTWQKRFMPELLAVAGASRFDAIVATHSPYIVGGRTELMSALDADRDDIEN